MNQSDALFIAHNWCESDRHVDWLVRINFDTVQCFACDRRWEYLPSTVDEQEEWLDTSDTFVRTEPGVFTFPPARWRYTAVNGRFLIHDEDKDNWEAEEKLRSQNYRPSMVGKKIQWDGESQ